MLIRPKAMKMARFRTVLVTAAAPISHRSLRGTWPIRIRPA